jgi:hypothetical protein
MKSGTDNETDKGTDNGTDSGAGLQPVQSHVMIHLSPFAQIVAADGALPW